MKKLIKQIKKLIQSIFKRFSSNAQQLHSPPSDTAIPTVTPRWDAGLVLVCSQCTAERSHSSHRTSKSSTTSEDLQNWLKSRLKFEGLWGEFRVVSTSCLGVCPKERVAVVSKGECLIVNPQSDRELLYSHIKQN